MSLDTHVECLSGADAIFLILLFKRRRSTHYILHITHLTRTYNGFKKLLWLPDFQVAANRLQKHGDIAAKHKHFVGHDQDPLQAETLSPVRNQT